MEPYLEQWIVRISGRGATVGTRDHIFQHHAGISAFQFAARSRRRSGACGQGGNTGRLAAFARLGLSAESLGCLYRAEHPIDLGGAA